MCVVDFEVASLSVDIRRGVHIVNGNNRVFLQDFVWFEEAAQGCRLTL